MTQPEVEAKLVQAREQIARWTTIAVKLEGMLELLALQAATLIEPPPTPDPTPAPAPDEPPNA